MAGLENTPSVGVIAQEVRDQAPLCVSHNVETDLYAVEYSKLIPYMIESIKALKRKCDLLEQHVGSTDIPRATEALPSEDEPVVAPKPKRRRTKA